MVLYAILIIFYRHFVIKRLLLSFHMPLFFFVSGVCAKGKAVNVCDRVKKLLVPQLTMGVISVLFEIFINYLLGNAGIDFKAIFKDWFLAWFLLVLLQTEIVFGIIATFFDLRKKHTFMILIGVNILCVYVVSFMQCTTWLHFEKIPVAMLFYLLGFGYRVYLEENKETIQYIRVRNSWPIFIPVSVLVSSVNSPVAMYMNSYGNLLLFLLGALSGIILVVVIAKKIQTNNFLEWIGRNSIVIYVLHFKLLEGLHGLGNAFFDNIDNCAYPYNWFYFCILIIIFIPIICICEKYFWFLFGKKKPIVKQGMFR